MKIEVGEYKQNAASISVGKILFRCSLFSLAEYHIKKRKIASRIVLCIIFGRKLFAFKYDFKELHGRYGTAYQPPLKNNMSGFPLRGLTVIYKRILMNIPEALCASWFLGTPITHGSKGRRWWCWAWEEGRRRQKVAKPAAGLMPENNVDAALLWIRGSDKIHIDLSSSKE